MTPEEQAAAEAAAREAASQQTPEQIAEAERLAAEAAANQKPIYTAEELAALTPTDIDLERVDPAYRPIVENTIRDYKALQADHTRKSQKLAELEKTETEEVYFEDGEKNRIFKNYLTNPLKIIADINVEIAKLETVIPEDGADQYRQARKTIAQWNGIKDEFQAKRMEVTDKKRQSEIDETKLFTELGAEASALLDYAKTLGFSERDFKSKPEVRAAVKKTYTIVNAETLAKKKEVKTLPHRSATPGGPGGGDKILDEFNPELTSAERIDASRKRRTAEGRF